MSGGALLKRILVRLLIVVVVWAGLSYVPDLLNSTTKHFEITRAQVRVEVNDDASLTVKEQLTFDFTGSFRGAYRDIPLREGAQLTGLAVFDGSRRYQPGGNTTLGSTDQPGRFGVTRTPDGPGVRVVWHYRASDTERTFVIAYRVEDAIVAYGDVLDAGWFVWGDQWDFWLDDLEAEIVPPPGSEVTNAWVQPRSLGAEPTVGAEATMSAERAKQGEAVQLRGLIPRDAVDSVAGARVESGDGAEKVIAAAERVSDGLFSKAANFVTDNAVLLFALWTALGVLLASILAVRTRERPISVPRHLPEPPEEIPPALAYALATEGEYDDRVVLATLLDLIDRGYYRAAASSDADLDLDLSVAAERPATEALTSYEREALDFFDDLLGSKTVALSGLKDEIPEHSSKWRDRWQKLGTELDQAEEGELGWDRDLTGSRALVGLIAFVGYVLLSVLYFTRTGLVVIPITATLAGMLFIYLLPATALKRLDPAGRRRNAEWAAFRRWTSDFPRLDDDPPATLKLWRSILVYAVAFGTAERVAKSGRIPAPVGEQAVADASWTVFALHGGSWNSDFNGFASGFSSQVAPESSSSGGGGGGGGFSGGGGGGAW